MAAEASVSPSAVGPATDRKDRTKRGELMGLNPGLCIYIYSFCI